MSRLVDELLLLARLDERPELERRPVDVATVAGRVFERFHRGDPGRSPAGPASAWRS